MKTVQILQKNSQLKNNIIAIHPDLLPAIQSPDMSETKKGETVSLFCKSSAVLQKQHKEIP